MKKWERCRQLMLFFEKAHWHRSRLLSRPMKEFLCEVQHQADTWCIRTKPRLSTMPCPFSLLATKRPFRSIVTLSTPVPLKQSPEERAPAESSTLPRPRLPEMLHALIAVCLR